ncbi:MAG: hypothetical protein NTZ93_05100 [Candidatus Beckwithbacteria bacterium]|nr:hypothetical protein [Candidatus Beckwithbacteria bacterium]
MVETISKRHGLEYSVKVDWLMPQELQGVIDNLTAFGRDALFGRGRTDEGRVKVTFIDSDATMTILISGKPITLRTPLRLRKYHSSVKALEQVGVEFGVFHNDFIIVRSTHGSGELDMGDERQSVAVLNDYLRHYSAIATVEAKGPTTLINGRKSTQWEALLPEGRRVLIEPLI